jgi:heme/copper-type cytochrome/quinol oxidase subunit 3
MTATTRHDAPARITPPGRRVPGEEGVWVFVLGDMTVFALFFATFMYSRAKNPDTFSVDHASLNVVLGTVNTVLLLTGLDPVWWTHGQAACAV